MKVNKLTQLLESIEFKKETWDSIKDEVFETDLYNTSEFSVVKWWLNKSSKIVVPPGMVFTARDNGKLIGYSGVGIIKFYNLKDQEDKGIGGNLNIYVHPDYRGLGYGKKLCRIALENFNLSDQVFYSNENSPWMKDLIINTGFTPRILNLSFL